MLGYPIIRMKEIIRLYAPSEFRHWFDADTLNFFNCVLPDSGIKTNAGNYFITAERPPGRERRFTVRHQDLKGNIDTVGEFQQHATFEEARDALRDELQRLKDET
jgi:hypothetical protein